MPDKHTKKKVLPIFPVLLAIYPILFLYSHNIAEVQFKHTILPMLLAVILAALVWGGSFFILKNRAKSAVGSAVFIQIFFLYGHIFEQLELLDIGLDIPIARHYYFIPFCLGLGSFFFYLIKKAKGEFDKVNYLLNTAAIFLILFNIFNIVNYEIKKSRFVHTFTGNFHDVPISAEAAEALKTKKLPDIYYIILDEYAAPGSVKRIYNYDSSDFIRNLQELGFYIANESKTKYKSTGQSIASSLNMNLIKKGDRPYALIRNNRVMNLFKNAGYKTIIFPVREHAIFNKSDEVYDYAGIEGSAYLNSFYVSLLKTTMLKFLCEWNVTEKQYAHFFRRKILFIFEKLAELAASKGPKFIYAHIESPHSPFVFDRDGGPVDPAHMNDVLNKKYYLDQYIYINKKVKELAKTLLGKSESPPVIIFQSDHGFRGMADFFSNREKLEVGDEWRHILNAYYLPGESSEAPYPAISPYNTFRLIFNRYFNTRFPLLQD
jgi:hypothetical protein